MIKAAVFVAIALFSACAQAQTCADGQFSNAGVCEPCVGEADPSLNIAATTVVSNFVNFVVNVPWQADATAGASLACPWGAGGAIPVSAPFVGTAPQQSALGSNNCIHTYTIPIPWAYLGSTANCVLSNHLQGTAGDIDSPSELVSTGSLALSFKTPQEVPGETSIFDEETSAIIFQLVFATEVFVTLTDLTVAEYCFANPSCVFVVNAAVVASTMDTIPPITAGGALSGSATGSFTLETFSNLNFDVTAPTVITSAAGVTITAPTQPDADSQTCTGDTGCNQFFTFTFAAGTPACTLNGDYSVVFPVACTTDGVCPLSGGETVTISFSLQSANFCGAITPLSISVIPTVTVYSDAAFSLPATAWVAGRAASGPEVYILASFASAAISILSVTVHSIDVTTTDAGALDISLWASSAITAAGRIASAVVVASTVAVPSICSASFEVLNSQFLVPRATSTTFDIVLVFDVVYVDTASPNPSSSPSFKSMTIVQAVTSASLQTRGTATIKVSNEVATSGASIVQPSSALALFATSAALVALVAFWL